LEVPQEGTSLEEIERELIQIALKQSGGNQTWAARLLDISRDALRYRMKKFELVKNSRDGESEAEKSPPDVPAL
jgi:DNA-binding NtrC family response regulator